MKMLLALLALTAAPALAQATAAPPPAPAPAVTAPAPKPATTRVVMTTAEGPITLELERERAPVTTANFLRYVDQKRLDGTVFYRAVNVAPGFGLVQGGARNEPKRVLPNIAHEPTTKTGLSHTDGTISMAMGAPGTANGDFFIVVGDLASLDAKDGQPGFPAFGRVVEGMDVVRRILASPIDPARGEGSFKGQMLANPVRIVSVRREAPATAAPR